MLQNFPAKRVKQQAASLSATSTVDDSDFCHSVVPQSSATAEAVEAAEVSAPPIQSFDATEEACADSPTKAALAPFCGLRPVLRRSPRKMPSFANGFESPQKMAFVAERKRQSVSRRNICHLIDSAGANGQEADDCENEEPEESAPFEGSETVEDTKACKPKVKRVAKRPEGNFVRLNMRKKNFVRGHTSATTKRKFWNRRRFMNMNRK
uniref:Uncharacterized protein n=1 Tax=Plectus sambesii TaxID=2011161 RepID=A0A914WMS5_9BILA